MHNYLGKTIKESIEYLWSLGMVQCCQILNFLDWSEFFCVQITIKCQSVSRYSWLSPRKIGISSFRLTNFTYTLAVLIHHAAPCIMESSWFEPNNSFLHNHSCFRPHFLKNNALTWKSGISMLKPLLCHF